MDLIPDDLRPFAGVLFLTLLYVGAAHLIHRYRLWQAEKMLKVRGLLRGAERISTALDAMGGLPLPRDLLNTLVAELLARYKGVQALFPHYEGIEDLISDAQGRIRPGTADPGWKPPSLTERTQLEHYLQGLTGLVAFFQEERPMEVSAQQAREWRERLRTLRAETRSEFARRNGRAAAERGDWAQAEKESQRLVAFLKQKAPRNERGKQLYREAVQFHQQIIRQQLPEPHPAEKGRG